MHSDTHLVEVVAELPKELPVAAGCLERRYDVQLGSASAELVTPILANYDDGREYVAAPAVHSVRDEVDWSDYLHDYHPWGSVLTWKNGVVTKIGLRRVLFCASVERTALSSNLPHLCDELAKEIYESSSAWFDRLTEWIGTACNVLLDASDREPPLRHGYFAYDGEHGRNLNPGPRVMKAVYLGGRFADESSLEQAIVKSNHVERPPLEHRLLLEAKARLRAGDTRRAVLDAASATEIALTVLLDKSLQGLPTNIVNVVQRERRGISDLAAVLRSDLGVTVRTDLVDSVARPRNKAIHSGQVPSRDVAAKAVKAAEET